MIDKYNIENMVRKKLLDVLSIRLFYQFSNYEIVLNEILLKQSLRFANPKTFKDPFDCNEILIKIKHKDSLVDDILSSWEFPLSGQERRNLKRKLRDFNYIASQLRKERDKFKMSCFTKDYKNIKMWFQFADNHNGMCVGFNFPHKYEEKFILATVDYIDKLEDLNGESDVYRTLLYWFALKFDIFCFEEEVRAINKCKSRQDYEYINYDEKYIQEIIFGANVSTSQIEYAMTKIKNSNIDFDRIAFNRMKFCKNKESLETEIIKPSA